MYNVRGNYLDKICVPRSCGACVRLTASAVIYIFPRRGCAERETKSHCVEARYRFEIGSRNVSCWGIIKNLPTPSRGGARCEIQFDVIIVSQEYIYLAILALSLVVSFIFNEIVSLEVAFSRR